MLSETILSIRLKTIAPLQDSHIKMQIILFTTVFCCNIIILTYSVVFVNNRREKYEKNLYITKLEIQ